MSGAEHRNRLKRLALIAAMAALWTGAAAAAERRIGDEVLRDPTRPAGAAAPEAAETAEPGNGTTRPAAQRYRVSFIRAGGDRPLAVVNGTQVMPGDEIDGARVVAIEPGHVTLDIDGEERRIATFRGNLRRSDG